MRVYKCDHCGKYMRWSDSYEIEMEILPPFIFTRTKHLCKDCYSILCEWLSDPKAKEENDAVR